METAHNGTKRKKQTIVDFCKEHNITKGSYHYWRKKVRYEERVNCTQPIDIQSEICNGHAICQMGKDWYRMGLILPCADMANWIIRCCGEWLLPIYNRIHEILVKCHVLHMDETRIQCNKEEGKKASGQSFMWVIRSAEWESIQAVFFHYSRSRNGKIAQELLSRFRGYLITDAYDGYNHIDDVIRVLCWAHCRRIL